MLKEGEVVIHEEGASHFHHFIAVGGKMKLTNHRVLFCTNNHQACYHHELSLDLKDISSVEFFKTMLMNPNGMALMMKNGNMENFIVDDRKFWRDNISRLITQVA